MAAKRKRRKLLSQYLCAFCAFSRLILRQEGFPSETVKLPFCMSPRRFRAITDLEKVGLRDSKREVYRSRKNAVPLGAGRVARYWEPACTIAGCGLRSAHRGELKLGVDCTFKMPADTGHDK